MKLKQLVSLITILAIGVNAQALTFNFIEDTPTALNFEMSSFGPTPGDQNALSPSGTWGIYAFVHQFAPVDKFAEIGGFVKKLLPVSEVVGTDVILPQIRGYGDIPFSQNAVGEFGDMYTGSFKLLPGSGMNAQQWDWVMTIKTATASNPSTRVPNTTSTALLLIASLSGLALFRKSRLKH